MSIGKESRGSAWRSASTASEDRNLLAFYRHPPAS
jgi:hypothetical protein